VPAVTGPLSDSTTPAITRARAWFTAGAVEGVTGLTSLASRLAVVGAGLAAAAVVFVGAATILRVEELQRLLGRLRGT